MDNGGFQLTAVGRKPPSDEGGGFAAGEDGGRESGAFGMIYRRRDHLLFYKAIIPKCNNPLYKTVRLG